MQKQDDLDKPIGQDRRATEQQDLHTKQEEKEISSHTLKSLKNRLKDELKNRVEDKILEEANAELLIKLIDRAQTTQEALSIAALGTTWKRTGFHFDKRLEKQGDSITYLKKDENLSFKSAFNTGSLGIRDLGNHLWASNFNAGSLEAENLEERNLGAKNLEIGNVEIGNLDIYKQKNCLLEITGGGGA
ncbi:hypothetical protein [Helicobacter sp. MIT 14-3879]|uniref:hypothetical protein n=1 Tax=Helicobacter sp. MIT 14-3879 TaxID=2040649 RepID=UPI000E1F633D|nr:hypothetical protein [Helicobacter sp. MIT 14-3879]RDU60589.1 hypothetical protein CQA44_10440 [Helicobacter sp. MIT 14-3879]